MDPSRRHSLSTKVTVFTLAIFLMGLWSHALYATWVLRDDMARLLGQQLYASVSYIARDVDQAIQERTRALRLAVEVAAPVANDPQAMQVFIEQRRMLTSLFNAGVVGYAADGTAIAEVPRSAMRVGTNYMDVETVAIALTRGEANIGRPVLGKKIGAPVFGMTEPIRDAQGRVVGALAGVTNLGVSNFLSSVSDGSHGRGGSHLIVSTQHRMIVTASDPRRILEQLPPAGVNPTIDRYIDGEEGHSIFTNPLGVEVLVAVKRVPAAGWYVAITLPTEEAFAPIRAMQRRMLGAALILTVMAGFLTWWMIRRQLSPMLAAARALARYPSTDGRPQPLPIARQDEIGDLIGGFNRLLAALGEREAALRDGDETLRSILAATTDGYWRVDLQGRLIDVNPSYCRETGYSRDELLALNVRDLDASEDATDPAGHLQRVVTQGSAQYETRHRRKDGTQWDVEVSAIFHPAGQGQFIAFLRNITERKNAQQALVNSERRFRDLVDTTDGIVWEADARTFEFSYISEEAERLLGYPRSEWAKPGFWVDHLHPDDKGWAPAYCASCTEKAEPHDFEYRFIARDGRAVWLHDLVAVVSEDGRPRWLRGIMVDITRNKLAEAELERHRDHLEELVRSRTAELADARDDAQAASRTKSVFLANMSHELRTPLNGIMGMTELALMRATDPKQVEYLTQSMEASRHLLAIINDVLDLSRIEANRMTLERRDFSLADLVDEAMRMQELPAREKGLALAAEMDPTLPERLRGDPLRLKQVLLNFIANAIKFSDQGLITIRARNLQPDPGGVLLRLEVSDQGIGLGEEHKARLFHAFSQADDSTTRRYGGSGLGLVICKRIAQLMSGEVGVESELGKGSTFWATARVERAADGQVATPSAEQTSAAESIARRFRGQRVLVVEDDPVSRLIAQQLLLNVGLEVETAHDGRQAIEQVRHGDFALVLMDVQMPVLNGLEATAEIRKLPGVGELPILALTAGAFEDDRERCLQAGMNDHVGKPIASDALYAAIAKWLPQAAAVHADVD